MKTKRLLQLVSFVAGVAVLTVSLIAQTKSVKADDLPVIYKSGTLTNSETWSASNVYFLTGQLTVPDGVTLTIPAGTIVKVNYHSGGIKTLQGGQVYVNGQQNDEVIFTSYRDDSYGGDTNGDNDATTPNNSDYGTALESQGGSLNVENVILRYASSGLNASCTYTNGAVQVRDSLFNSPAVFSNCGSGVVALERNYFDTYTSNNSEAIYMYRTVPTGVILSGINKNSFSSYNNTFRLYGNSHTIPTGSSWAISGDSGAVMRISDVGIEGELVINEGAVIKTGYHERGLHVEVGGELSVQGTDAKPVIFTSSRDDSVGGDTDRDGPSTPGDSDYNAIEALNGETTINISHSLVRHSDRSVTVDCVYTSSSTILTDNTFKGNVGIYKCEQDQASLQRNHFELGNSGWPAVSLFNTPPAGLTLIGVDKNNFIGDGIKRVVDISTSSEYTPLVASGKTLTLDSTGGAVFRLSYPKVNGTLNLNAGTIVKVGNGNGFKLGTGSILNVNGTTGLPVTITSYKDDSIGGDSNGDGATSPGNNDIGVILSVPEAATINSAYLHAKYASWFVSMQNGNANFADTQVSHVNTGLSVSGGHVIYRGIFDNVAEKYIRSCNWGANCSVDAAYIDWGDSSGPFTAPGVQKACGTVTVSPWKIGSSFTGVSAPFDIPNCDNSPTPVDTFIAAQTAAQQQVAQRRIDCNNGFQDACDAIANALGCLGAAVQLAASQSPIPVTFDNPTETVDTVGQTMAEAADTFIRASEVEHPPTFSLTVATKVLGVVNLYNALTDAYDSCSP